MRGNAQDGERPSALQIFATINLAVAIFVVQIVDALIDFDLADACVACGLRCLTHRKSRVKRGAQTLALRRKIRYGVDRNLRSSFFLQMPFHRG